MINQCKVFALQGNPIAMRLCMERLLPSSKLPNTPFRLPPMGTLEELVKAVPALIREVARGRLSAEDAEALSRIIGIQLHAIEVENFDARIRDLETKTLKAPPKFKV